MAKLYKTDGTVEAVAPVNGKTFELDQLKALVGGWIECVYLDSNKLFVINEEGKLHGLPINEAATIIASSRLFPGDYIAGNAVMLKAAGEDMVPLDD